MRIIRTRLADVQDWEALAEQAGYRVGELAALTGYCQRQLERYFSKSMHCTVKIWLDSAQMRRARELLNQGDRVKKVAEELGFEHATHFCQKFKRLERRTPRLRKNRKRMKLKRVNLPPLISR